MCTESLLDTMLKEAEFGAAASKCEMTDTLSHDKAGIYRFTDNQSGTLYEYTYTCIYDWSVSLQYSGISPTRLKIQDNLLRTDLA